MINGNKITSWKSIQMTDTFKTILNSYLDETLLNDMIKISKIENVYLYRINIDRMIKFVTQYDINILIKSIILNNINGEEFYINSKEDIFKKLCVGKYNISIDLFNTFIRCNKILYSKDIKHNIANKLSIDIKDINIKDSILQKISYLVNNNIIIDENYIENIGAIIRVGLNKQN